MTLPGESSEYADYFDLTPEGRPVDWVEQFGYP
jgi:hypothetical protein